VSLSLRLVRLSLAEQGSQQEKTIRVDVRTVPVSAGWERLWRWLLAPRPENGTPKNVNDDGRQ